MQIYIHNTISMEGETEIINESHNCEWKQKGNYDYLIYHNSDGEKVVIKFNDDELTMTRFSAPKTVMRFTPSLPSTAVFPTPVGMQYFQIETGKFTVDREQQTIQINYLLKSSAPETKGILASYHLKIFWRQ
ncbi:DUF1934 domain-containing protein [Streptococcus dentasini]